ncbi:MAG TPA: VWA domain-containing protein, partial [Gemmataceae bacterium]|nr:VWA domain-containing protein [Gemmataceae bacterium]
GTAKSTAARALADLLPPLDVVAGCPFNCAPESRWPECPHCASQNHSATKAPVPFIDLPLGATEDRVLGTLDLQKALGQGKSSFQPGLLAATNRGILYIDEVNLLADHLVDVLLDAAASGINSVQREGMAVVHPARFLLIGTMNPEEGKLRPQLLDRFGLVVDIAGAREPETRTEVVRRRLAFETNPKAFLQSWAKEQETLRQRIIVARNLLSSVMVDDELVLLISQICCEHQVDGLRADIVMHKTAQAMAAFDGRTAVTPEDVRVAAELALPHRRRSRQSVISGQQSAITSRQTAGNDSPPKNAKAKDQEVFEPAPPEDKPHLPKNGCEKEMMASGRRQSMAAKSQGRFVRAVADETPASLALAASLRAAARRGSFHNGKLKVETVDLHRKEFESRTGIYLLFVVDSSGSMATRRRMELVKGTVLNLLQDAYEKRDQVGVIAFRGIEARVLLPFTADVEEAEQALRELPTGGRTPLAHALVLAGEMIERVRRSHPDAPVLLALLSDGKANVSLPGTEGDPWQQALLAAERIAEMKISSLVLDSAAGFVQTGRAQELAQALAAEYQVLGARSGSEELSR